MLESSRSNGELLIRIDERTKRTDTKLGEFSDRTDKNFAALEARTEKRLDRHTEQIDDLQKDGRRGVIADVGAYLTGVAAIGAAFFTGKQ